MIFDEKKVIFLHYPKTGGNSIQDALREYCTDKIITLGNHQDGFERFEVRNESYKKLVKHSSLQDYYNAIGEDIYYYKIFITIRNPFDRMVSFYFSPHRGDVRYERNDFAQFIKNVKPLEKFIYLEETVSSRNQLYGNINFLRFEHLNKDFMKITRELGIQGINLPHRNSSKRNNYKSYYDKELINIILNIHKYEIALGNYSF